LGKVQLTTIAGRAHDASVNHEAPKSTPKVEASGIEPAQGLDRIVVAVHSWVFVSQKPE
jgi:hypothetical protein